MTDPAVHLWRPWTPTPADVAALEAEHRERVRAADPLATAPDLLGPGDDVGQLLAVRLPDGSRAAAAVSTTEIDPRSQLALFRALREHRARVRAAGPDVTGAVAALVAAWRERSGARAVRLPDRTDEDLVVLWPSRDAAAAAGLAGAGLGPVEHLAARRDASTGRPATLPRGVVLRDATASDVEAVTDHQLDELAYDALVGAARVRDGAREVLHDQVAGAIGRESTTVLVAQDATGEVLGVVAVEPPERSGHVAGALARGPVAYVVLLHVAPRTRGAGLGSALVEAALARVRAGSGPGTVPALHHGALNALSTPFWAGQGFRPVLTTWRLPVGGST